MRTIQSILDELIDHQENKLYTCAQEIIPGITKDDMLQPNDFPKLDNHPYFRYEEGILEGLRTVKMALAAELNIATKEFFGFKDSVESK